MTGGGRLDFGAMLRRYRLAAGLTQEELAERAHLSGRGITDLERGVRRAPRPDTVALLVEALALAPHDRAAFEVAARQHRVQLAATMAGEPDTPSPTQQPPPMAASWAPCRRGHWSGGSQNCIASWPRSIPSPPGRAGWCCWPVSRGWARRA